MVRLYGRIANASIIPPFNTAQPDLQRCSNTHQPPSPFPNPPIFMYKTSPQVSPYSFVEMYLDTQTLSLLLWYIWKYEAEEEAFHNMQIPLLT